MFLGYIRQEKKYNMHNPAKSLQKLSALHSCGGIILPKKWTTFHVTCLAANYQKTSINGTNKVKINQ